MTGKEFVAGKTTKSAKPKREGIAPLLAEVRSLIQSARHTVASAINTLQVLTNFEIGRRIVEHEQRGEQRAEYGQNTGRNCLRAFPLG